LFFGNLYGAAHFLREERAVVIKQVVSDAPDMFFTDLSTESGEKITVKKLILR